MSKQYFWNDQYHNFGSKKFGEEVTSFLVDKEGEEDPRVKGFLESGKISTKKPQADKPFLGEVESLKAQVKSLQELLSEKEVEFNELRAKKNSEVGGSLQSDLDRIAELEAQLESLTAPSEPEKAGPGRPKKGE